MGSGDTALSATGALVSNTYATCPSLGHNPWKRGLIPHTHVAGIGYV